MDLSSHDYIMDKQETFGCSMVQMSDDELSGVTAGYYSSFSLDADNGIARAWFNVTAKTYTEVDSIKMGYYNGGWDENWEGVSFGTSTTDLICQGIYIEAKFTNIATSASRTLDSIKVGVDSMSGPISGNFISFSGQIQGPTGTDIYNGYRLSPGQMTIHTNNSNFSMQLSRTAQGTQPAGWWFFWDNSTVTYP